RKTRRRQSRQRHGQGSPHHPRKARQETPRHAVGAAGQTGPADGAGAGVAGNADSEVISRQLLRIVEVDFTPPTWRAFCRQVIDGVPAAQVAEELELSLNAVLLAKSRVLRRLRQELRGLVA